MLKFPTEAPRSITHELTTVWKAMIESNIE